MKKKGKVKENLRLKRSFTIINQETTANIFNNHFLQMADLTKTANIKDINPHIENSMKYLNTHRD